MDGSMGGYTPKIIYPMLKLKIVSGLAKPQSVSSANYVVAPITSLRI